MDYLQDEINRSNSFAEEMQNKFDNRYAFKHFHQRQSEFILSVLDGMNIECLLEIGCGIGDFLSVATSKFKSVYGIDPSPKSIEIAKFLAPNADTRTGTGENLPYDSDFADVIVMKGVVHHLKDPTDVFKEACRCLKTGGALLILEGNKSSFYRNLILWVADLLGIHHELSLFEHRSPATMIEMLEEAGMSYERTFYISGLFTPLSHANLGGRRTWFICDLIENLLQKIAPKLFNYHVILTAVKI